MIDNQTLREVDAANQAFEQGGIRTVAAGTRDDIQVVGDEIWPDDVFLIFLSAACADENANGFRAVLESPGSGHEVFRTHTGDGSNPEELKAALSETFMICGDELGSVDGHFPSALEVQFRNDAASDVDIHWTIWAWKLNEDFASAGENRGYTGFNVTNESVDP